MKTLFQYSDYKPYMIRALENLGHGSRKQLASQIKCQSAYVAQVLNGNAHFSLEQAEDINDFLAHTQLEGEYFLELISYCRAGTSKLRERFRVRTERLRAQSQKLAPRIRKTSEVSGNDLVQYYSSWVYMAVHALCTLEGYDKPRKFAERLDIPAPVVEAVLTYLLEKKVIRKSAGRFVVDRPSFHLSEDSLVTIQHHLNWRMKALQLINRFNRTDWHYTSVITVSHAERELIQEKLTTAINQIRAIIDQSTKQECMMGLSVDFLEI